MKTIYYKLLATVLTFILATALLPQQAFTQPKPQHHNADIFYNNLDLSPEAIIKAQQKQDAKTPSQKRASLLSDIRGNMHINNTGYTPPLGMAKINKYNIDERIPAAKRYMHSTDEIKITGIHGLYPAIFNLNAKNMADLIQKAVNTYPSQQTATVLTLFLTDYKAHELAYVEALLGLAQISATVDIENKPKLDKALKQDLNTLFNFTEHEVIYGSGQEYDAYLRNRIRLALIKLGTTPQANADDKAQVAQVRSKVTNVLGKIQTGASIISIAALATGGVAALRTGAGSFKAAPVQSYRPTMSIATRTIPGTGTPKTYTIGMKSTPRTYGANALKANYQTVPTQMHVLQTQPVQIATPVLNNMPAILPVAAQAPYLNKFQNYHTNPHNNPGIAPVPADGKPAHVGEKLKKLTKEQLDNQKALEIEIALNNDYLIAKPFSYADIWALQIPMRAKIRLLNIYTVRSARHIYAPGKPLWENALADIKKQNMPATRAYKLVEANEQQLQKYFALTENYIEGYYQRRIYPYLNKVSYQPTGDGKALYRGMFITTQELKNILQYGMDISLTKWHTGAKNNAPIISSSLSEQEAISYIFQSNMNKTRDNAIGVLFKLKKDSKHLLFNDAQLNSTNTIYHTYSSIPADDIEGVYILGQYGAETINNAIKDIEQSRVTEEWLNTFDKGVMLR